MLQILMWDLDKGGNKHEQSSGERINELKKQNTYLPRKINYIINQKINQRKTNSQWAILGSLVVLDVSNPDIRTVYQSKDFQK